MLFRHVAGIVEGGAAEVVGGLGVTQEARAAMHAGHAEANGVGGSGIEQAFVEQRGFLVAVDRGAGAVHEGCAGHYREAAAAVAVDAGQLLLGDDPRTVPGS
ncbi:hypothetical protein D3C76_1410340 [compost metagenome]